MYTTVWLQQCGIFYSQFDLFPQFAISCLHMKIMSIIIAAVTSFIISINFHMESCECRMETDLITLISKNNYKVSFGKHASCHVMYGQWHNHCHLFTHNKPVMPIPCSSVIMVHSPHRQKCGQFPVPNFPCLNCNYNTIENQHQHITGD